MSEKNGDHRRFSEMLPFYVNDTLSPDEHIWMESYLTNHPELENEKRFVEHLAKLTKETASPIPEQVRLDRFLSQWHEKQPAPSLLQRIRASWQGPIRIPAPVLATVAVMVIAQSAIIGSLVSNSSPEDTFRGERADCIAPPRIRVVFNPDAKHVEIVLLLRKLEMTVQEGPSETGEFWLTVPKGRLLEEGRAMLRSSALVEEAITAPDTRPTVGCTK